ncbi:MULTISPECIES: PAS domain-containing protein [unclassified Xanthobacter]|uniref:PAS domain-containing protein n=1 Tax=unclassified Xanthobacter TaxID=2623496 RepID=UPI001EDFFC69|nr:MULTISPECIES: PAS domain-containing protein [unclassified Xanthobacter]
MTETKARIFDLSEPRLAPLRQDRVPAFLVDAQTAVVLSATPASADLGVVADAPLPPSIAEIAQQLAWQSGPTLVRLRPPGDGAHQVFRCLPLDLEGHRTLLFSDPAVPDAAAPIAAPAAPAPAVERFTFEMDAEDRFRSLSPVLAGALGATAGRWIGARVPELEAAGLVGGSPGGGGVLTDVLAQGVSFSGIRLAVRQPQPLDLELGGVPLLDPRRRKLGTRGFGLLRRGAMPMTDEAPAMPSPPAPESAAPVATNVVPFGSALSARDSKTFEEIGRALTGFIGGEEPDAPGPAPDDDTTATLPAALPTAVLDALPLATVLADADQPVHANRTFFDWTGWPDLAAVEAAGGLDHAIQIRPQGNSSLMTATGERLPVTARTMTAPFLSPDARLHVLRRLDRANELDPPARAPEDSRRAALDLVPWPLLLIDAGSRILFANRATVARFGFPAEDITGHSFILLVAPAQRAGAYGWLEGATAGAANGDGAIAPLQLTLRARNGEELEALAGLARISEVPAEFCLVFGPTAPPASAPAADAAGSSVTAPQRAAAATNDAAAQTAPTVAPSPDPPAEPAHQQVAPRPPEAALQLVARRLAESLAPAFATLRDPARQPDDSLLPPDLRAAMETVQQSLDDLSALATPLGEPPLEPTAPAALVHAALAELRPVARRRHVTVRTDIDDVPQITSAPPRLARLVRLMLEEALSAAPADSTIIISLTCEDPDGTSPVYLQINDAGDAVDEVDDAAARRPLTLSPGTDRFSRAGRPLRLARLVAEADALGARFEIVRGRPRGMCARLTLPR